MSMKTSMSAAMLAAGLVTGAAYSLGAQTPGSALPQSGANEEPTRPQAQQGERVAAATSLSAQDRSFIEQAAKGGMAEVQEAKLAQQKASSDEVKQSASRLEADHSQANAKLEKIAAANGVTLPADQPPERKAMQDELRKLQGEQFDRRYVSGQISNHEKTIALFEKQGANSGNPQIAAFARETLPTLKHHLEMMRGLQKE